ncbi:peptidoglycan DD-metalloendopeptidase family protein [Patescibacteria group bacterium]|nr:peptidoglycan DD-metalloendopeptidase family protein [Patescibacteria group bacterium]
MTKEDSIFKRISFRGIKISFLSKTDRVARRFKRVTVKTKVGYENLNIEEKAKTATLFSVASWQSFSSNLKHIFKKPVRHVSHFGLILIILIVLASGVPMPEKMKKSNEIPVDPFGMIKSTRAYEDEEIDITELEAVAMSVSFINIDLANKVYEKIGENSSDSQIILAGDTIANTSIINTESSAKTDKKFERYIVQSGDTLSGIATKFSVSTNSIKWSNSSIKDIDNIKPGTALNIPTVTGILHTVASGDSIESLAAKYKSQASLIISYNDLYGEELKLGDTLLIPDGQKEDPKPVPAPPTIASGSASRSSASGRYGSSSSIASSGTFRFPTVIGRSGYYNGYHWWAIDIPNSIGTPIYAADSGRIVEARYGYNGGYGNTILIDHGNGYQTRYAHMTTLVLLGGYASKGQVIGYMGSTGRSTGSHLHFEIIYRGAKQNPTKYF